MGRIRKFLAVSAREKLLFVEALSLHLWVGLLLKIIPFRWIPRLFSSRHFEAPTQEETQSRPRSESGQRLADLELIRTAIQRAGKVSPWKNKCLVSSLAARRMLRCRRIESLISLGVTKNEKGKMIAHAWIRAGDYEIVPRDGEYVKLYGF
ncbi:MAG: lasso peptide biosynthesis B2 protein [Bacteroidales bacterium]|nr:lasso peptide biosynthesis B2 protein [Bacteroidales bacterium]